MEILTDTNRDMSRIREASTEPVNRLQETLLSQNGVRPTDVNNKLVELDKSAQELIEKLLDMFENG
ncbi:MAG: hypothetical protein MUO76_03575 [Anaerolineaceae bacterium]|nr:hypothetical protein [Anaerolineaceae bacterium]